MERSGKMHVVRCESPQAFLGRAEGFLLADEACHNLLLGVPVILPGTATEGTPARAWRR
ncbi:MAG TPA: hypothetical protein VGA35_15200 [bacterium]